MKKSAKKNNNPAKTTKNPGMADETPPAPAVSPTTKTSTAERVRQRAAASRKAALNKVVSQSPD